MKRIVVAKLTATEDGVRIDASTVVILNPLEEALIGRELEELGYRKFDREQLIKELAKQSAGKPLWLTREE